MSKQYIKDLFITRLLTIREKRGLSKGKEYSRYDTEFNFFKIFGFCSFCCFSYKKVERFISPNFAIWFFNYRIWVEFFTDEMDLGRFGFNSLFHVCFSGNHGFFRASLTQFIALILFPFFIAYYGIGSVFIVPFLFIGVGRISFDFEIKKPFSKDFVMLSLFPSGHIGIFNYKFIEIPLFLKQIYKFSDVHASEYVHMYFDEDSKKWVPEEN